MFEPQGPLPREIYIRRRVAAIAVVVAVLAIIGIVLYFAARDTGTDTSQSSGPATPAAAASSTTASSSAATTTSGAAPGGQCADSALRVTVWTAEPNVKQNNPVRIFTNVVNTGSSPCSRDLATAPLHFEVYRLDNNQRVWGSTDCTPPTGNDVVDLQPNQPVSRQIDWTGRQSAPGKCDEASRGFAPVGPYQVYALVGNVYSPAATFNITQ